VLDPDESAAAGPFAEGLEEHLRLALEAGELGTWRWDITTDRVEWDERLEALFGLEPGSYDHTTDQWLSLVHPDDRDDLMAGVRAAVDNDVSYVVRHRILLPDGAERWIEARGITTHDDQGVVNGTLGCAHEITDRVRVDRAQQEQFEQLARVAALERLNRERFEFLLQINDALGSTNDLHELMRRVTQAAVPRLGDWCIIYVLPSDGGRVPHIQASHHDPEMLEAARRFQGRSGYDPDIPFGAPEVIRTGRSEFYPHVDMSLAPGGETTYTKALEGMRMHSSMTAPIAKRGHVYGAVTFLTAGPDARTYDRNDLALAEAVAGRIASSLENLMLIEQQTEIAQVLQSSLLPSTLPEIRGIDLAVRYTPAGEGTEVGGDFYDVFALDDHRWGVAVGDVCGKGPRAAAVTALARHTIRTSAWHESSADLVLERLNEAVFRSDEGTFCTAVYGVLDTENRVLDLSIGGHPLPILVRPDGRCEHVGTPGMLLGAFDEPRTTAARVELVSGSTLLLYTDGVTDLPPPDELTPAEFAAIVERCTREAVDADDLLRLVSGSLDAIRPAAARSDDVALLAVRVL
jgi:PAS domain S-box-containing protein